VGYVGRDVESIVRDLADIAIKKVREDAVAGVKVRAEDAAEERVLDALLPPVRGSSFDAEESEPEESPTRQKFRKKLREGDLDEREIEIEVAAPNVGVEIMGPPGMEEMTSQLQGMFQNLGGKPPKPKKMRVKDALKLLVEEESHKMVDDEEIKSRAIDSVEQNGIVFLDEIDKVAQRSEGSSGGEVSREGVQRDLLPLVEGSTVSTKYGMIKTDHVLFIASGAFHLSKPSDLIPELQGRLPIRVELEALSVEDFTKILSEPDASLTEQYIALMKTDGVDLGFDESGILRIAEFSWQVNERTENIGARRLHTVMERLLEEISFEATDRTGESVVIDAEYVNKHLSELAENEDLSRYIL